MKVFFVCLLFCSFAFAETSSTDTIQEAQDSYNQLDTTHQNDTRSSARSLHREFRDYGLTALAMRSDQALDVIVKKGVEQLKEAGDDLYATQLESEWSEKFRGYLSHGMAQNGGRDIGDHKPLIEWLAQFYNRIEAVIGLDACKALHLSDIKTFNYCIPIVFHPCTFPMDAVTISREAEYRNHFDQGAVYYGLVPVITYWVVDIACLAATQGAGTVWLCSPLGSAGEFIMGKWFAPKLSDFVFEKACGSTDLFLF
jgi:hypothetical protein